MFVSPVIVWHNGSSRLSTNQGPPLQLSQSQEVTISYHLGKKTAQSIAAIKTKRYVSYNGKILRSELTTFN